MTVNPPTGFSYYNTTVIIGSSPEVLINSVFNSSSKQITSRLDIPGTYNLSVYEKNFDTRIYKPITVNQSNSYKLFIIK